MKYKTFRTLIIASSLIFIVGLTTVAYIAFSKRNVNTSVLPIPTIPAPITDPPPSATIETSSPVESAIMEFLSRPAVGNKVKDAFPREPYKVSFFRDQNASQWTRLKIDLNRNDKWDEKWELQDGVPVKRFVSTRDDEKYDTEYRRQQGNWALKQRRL